jgi:hypothetical protein
MADFSITTLFVAPVGQTAVPSSGSTQDLTAGQLGIFRNDYTPATAGNAAAAPYLYIAQGRENTYLQGSKRSDKIKGGVGGNVIEWYKVAGNPIALNQITEVSALSVKPNEQISMTIRAHSSYIDTLYFNGWTRSVTLPRECLDCGGDPCTEVDAEDVVDALIAKLGESAPGTNPDNINFDTFFTFTKEGTGAATKLIVEGKPLTKYGEPCDVSAFPHEYDRMWFEVFVYEGPDTTADFLTTDACVSVATVTTTQESQYASGTSEEIAQLEKNFHSYQAGYLKHLHRMVGYNQNFESFVNEGTNYTTYYIRFVDFDKDHQLMGDYVPLANMVIIAVESGSALETALEAILVAGLGAVSADNTVITTTTTTTT